MSISVAYTKNGQEETSTVNYYDVTQSITCTLYDVKKVAEVTTAVVTAGATEVGVARLRLSNPRKVRDEAGVQAVRTAHEKAVVLATELGVKVGKPYKVGESTYLANNEGSEDFSPVEQPVAGVRLNPDGTPVAAPPSVFAPGLLTIRASVEVTFYLE